MNRSRLLVVGAGQAALALAVSLRERGWDGLVTLVGDEAVGPYQRPPLSKGLLTGAVGADDLELRTAAVYAEQGIELLLGERVVAITRDSATGVATAVTSTGRHLYHDHLVLATGSRPRTLQVPGSDASGIFTLRTIDDAERLRVAMDEASSLVVVGGGFIGLEVASSAAARGLRVTVVESGPRILGRAVSTEVGTWLTQFHQDSGVELRTETGVAGFVESHGRVRGVELSDGTRVPADVVLVGVGAVPNTALAADLGLEVGDGVLVDRTCRASDGWTWALGDCAQVLDPSVDDAPARVRLESVDHAMRSAQVVAAALLGDPVEYRSVPWFWSDQGAAKLQIVGLRPAGCRAVTREVGEGKLLVAHAVDGCVVAVEAVNAPADFMAARTLLAGGHAVDAADFGDPEWSLRAAAKAVRGRTVSAG